MRLEEDFATENIPATFGREGLSEGCRHACIGPHKYSLPYCSHPGKHAAACIDRKFTAIFANELSCPQDRLRGLAPAEKIESGRHLR